MSAHVPVMLREMVEALAPRDGGYYVDGTFGGGGYTGAILSAVRCSVLGLDRDPEAIERAKSLVARHPGRLTVENATFSKLDVVLASLGQTKTDGVVLDLGVSSFQLAAPRRGFSFREDGPLDMRMSAAGTTAQDVVNTADEKELTGIFRQLGEERHAGRVARAIVAARPLSGTRQLADVISQALGPAAARQGIHPATRSFQALRIFVNDELGELERGLLAAERALREGGRLVVVAFHSLEDRIVKNFLAERSSRVGGSRHAPEPRRAHPQTFRLLSPALRRPDQDEIARNSRARSARLRAAERTSTAA